MTTNKDAFKKDILAKASGSHHFALEAEQSIAIRGFKILLEAYVNKEENPTVLGLLKSLSFDHMAQVAHSDGELKDHAEIYLATLGCMEEDVLMGTVHQDHVARHNLRMNHYVDVLWNDSFPL